GHGSWVTSKSFRPSDLAGDILHIVLSPIPRAPVDLFAHSAARRSLALPIRLRENLPGRATLCEATNGFTLEVARARCARWRSRIPLGFGFGPWDFLSWRRVRCPEGLLLVSHPMRAQSSCSSCRACRSRII